MRASKSWFLAVAFAGFVAMFGAPGQVPAAPFQVLVGYGDGANVTTFRNPQPATAVTFFSNATHFTHFAWGTGGSGHDLMDFGSGGLEASGGILIDGNFNEPFLLGRLVFVTSTTAVGEATSVDLQIVVTLTQPAGAAAPVVLILPLTIVTVPAEIIGGTQYRRGSRIVVPSTFPTPTFDVNGTPYRLRVIGFGSQASGGAITTVPSVDIPGDEVVAFADLFATLEGCGAPTVSREPPVWEGIGGFGACGPAQVGVPKTPTWGRFGTKRVLEFDSGEKLEMVCAGAGGLLASGALQMLYTRAGASSPLRVGLAPFEASCTWAEFAHSGDENNNCKPDRLVATKWYSLDYGENDTPNAWTGRGEFLDPPSLDAAALYYDAATNELAKTSLKYRYSGRTAGDSGRFFFVPPDYCARGKRADLESDSQLLGLERLDPPLGPETEAFFDSVLATLAERPPTGAPMEEGTAKLCDLNADGSCDPGDVDILARALGACHPNAAFDPRADADGNGCVDLADRHHLFADAVPVVEFYNASLDHYFISAYAAEIAALDAGTQIRGWTRTGLSFNAYQPREPNASTVCRFYIPPQLGDSHFFGRGAAECAATAQGHPEFTYEAPEVIDMKLPEAGVCTGGTIAVYRVFSNRADANHRYTTSRLVRDDMVAKGWLAEGDGPDHVVMCAPP